ncbi:MAG: hypothetical protein IJ438_12175 [Clostridia bacterium]|nr:hypothetical protein [Clostridia bacterium]
MGLIRRAAAIAAALLLAVSSAWAEEGTPAVRFTLSADLDAVQYPEAIRPYLEGLQSLLDAASFEGTLAAADGSFALDAAMLLGDTRTQGRIYGTQSHTGIASPLLGDTTLSVNHLSLLEFAVKGYNHLGLPLPGVALLVPYAHTSALAGIVQAAAPWLTGTQEVSHAELHALAESIAALAEEDRALYYWLEAVGLATESGAALHELVRQLPAYVDAAFPNGLSVVQDDASLRWQNGEHTVLLYQLDGVTTTLEIALTDLLELSATLRQDASFATGSLMMNSPILNAVVSFSLPTALPVTFPFSLHMEAECPVTGQPVQLLLEGEGRGSTLVIRQMKPDLSRTMLTITATLEPFTADALPAYTPETIGGVNILSATGDSLSALLHQVRRPMLQGLYDLLVAAPPVSVQSLMDALEDSGILGLITDSMMGVSSEY